MRRFILVFLLALFGVTVSQSQPAAEFQKYLTGNVKPKLELVFNQEKYAPGDTAFFKAWLLTENLVRMSGRHFMFFELTDAEGKLKHHFIYSTRNGMGNNQLVIPDSLKAGHYLVTSYLQNMRAPITDLFFRKKLQIVVNERLATIQKINQTFKIYPEGGSLINGISNKVVIETTPNMSVVLLNGSGEEIVRTTTDNSGYAFFIFTPQKNVSYYAEPEKGIDKVKLPSSLDDGCAVLLTNNGRKSPIRVLFALPSDSKLREETLRAVVSAGSRQFNAASFRFEARPYVSLQIQTTDLPAGVLHLSLLRDNETLIASRDFFLPETDSIQCSIQLKDTVYSNREKVTAGIQLTNSNGQPIRGDFAVSVINQHVLNGLHRPSFRKDLYFPTTLEDMEYSIDPWNASASGLDLFMIGHTEPVPWEILKEAKRNPLMEGMTMLRKNGRAYFLDTGDPVPDSTLLMVFLQKNLMTYQAFTRRNGQFELFLFDFYGQDSFFYMAEKEGRILENVKLKWEELPLKAPALLPFSETNTLDAYADFSKKKRTIDQAFSFPMQTTAVALKDQNPNAEFEEEFMGADIDVKVQDYVVFPDMDELLREIIPFLSHRKERGTDIVRVLLPEEAPRASADPLYVIDGIMTRNTTYFLSLKPVDILRIKIVKDISKLNRFGPMGKNGIVLVETRKGDASNFLKDDTFLAVDGLSRPVEFKKVKPRAPSLQRPDFRSTIYWNPSAETNNQGSATINFLTTDDIGPMKILIRGLTDDGQPFTAEKTFEVTFVPSKN